ncbi:oxidoreductase [Marinomonas agarivorans]|nr:oxidoreductase [Marinomonas agarivorans]
MKAIFINGKEKNSSTLAEIEADQLPDNDVLVNVDYSTLNYKDALAITGSSPVVRQFPMIPGIDLAGKVVSCKSGRFKKGDNVLLNGWGVGEQHWGGLAQYASVKEEWLVPLPTAFSSKQAMSLGTAGYTAMLCVQALEKQGIAPKDGPILVSGAAGGVGSIATFLLAQRGYEVTASTGRPHDSDYLLSLGAKNIIDRASLNQAGKPLQKELWVGAVDVVGSHTLANICASLQYGGAVAACGLAQGMDLPATVAPFILRGVSLLGIDSVYQPYDRRLQAWETLAKEIDATMLANVTTEIPLEDVIEKAGDLLAGQVQGRLVVNVN